MLGNRSVITNTVCKVHGSHTLPWGEEGQAHGGNHQSLNLST